MANQEKKIFKVLFYLKDYSQNTISIDSLSVIELNVLSVWNPTLTLCQLVAQQCGWTGLFCLFRTGDGLAHLKASALITTTQCMSVLS